MNRIKFTSSLSRGITALFFGAVLASCGGDDDVAPAPAPNTLSGTAAVGYPIVSGTVSMVCAAGVVPAINITSTAGAWQVPAAGLTLPCVVQVSGGLINGVTSTAKYHSIAFSIGTANITPLTDLIVANFAGRSDPDVWFTGLTPANVALITPASVSTALGKLRTAFQLTLLNTIDPITTVFAPNAGDPGDDLLVALKAAMTSTNVTHATLLSSAALPSFTPPTGFDAALATAFTGSTVSGGAIPPPPTGIIATTGDGQATITWNPVALATSYKLYMNTAPGITTTNPANMHHPSVTSPFHHLGLTNGTTWYFVVTAVNKNGESAGSAEVSATPQAVPVVALTATTPSIASGGTSTISWTSTNSTSCISSGGGGTGVTGTFTTPRLATNTTYTVTCAGANGTASQSKAVTVVGSLASFSSVTGGCVQDNVTGLMWEVKTIDGGLRDRNNTYTNYDSTLSAQKHNFAANTNSNPTQADIDAPTNSVGFKNSVNVQGLCGFSDWRLPTVDELQSIIKPVPIPTIDATWFPNTKADWYWTASPLVGFSYAAWGTNFGNGVVISGQIRSGSKYVRLVRGGGP